MSVYARFLCWIMIWYSNHRVSGASFQIASNATSSAYVLTVGKVHELLFDYTVMKQDNLSETGSAIAVSLSDNYIIDMISPEKHTLPPGSSSGHLKVRLEALLPGRANIRIQYLPDKTSKQGGNNYIIDFYLQVVKTQTLADKVFAVVVILVVGVTNVGLGCEIDLDVVMATLHRPVDVAIGLFSQYFFMPLIAYGVVKSIDLMPGVALGLFVLGCSPGGAASNAYCYLLVGNVTLSITMTLVSTAAALGLLPLWLFTLGPSLIPDTDIKIPYYLIVSTLMAIIIPCVMGIYIRRKHPVMSKCLISSIKYIMIFFCLFIFTVGVWINLHVFQLMRPRVLLASALIPYIGFLVGGLVGLLSGYDWVTIVSVAIETGVQNTGVPIVLLQLSLTGPEQSTSLVGIVANAFLMPLPIYSALLVIYIRGKCNPKHTAGEKEDLQEQNQNGVNLTNLIPTAEETGDKQEKSRDGVNPTYPGPTQIQEPDGVEYTPNLIEKTKSSVLSVLGLDASNKAQSSNVTVS